MSTLFVYMFVYTRSAPTISASAHGLSPTGRDASQSLAVGQLSADLGTDTEGTPI